MRLIFEKEVSEEKSLEEMITLLRYEQAQARIKGIPFLCEVWAGSAPPTEKQLQLFIEQRKTLYQRKEPNGSKRPEHPSRVP